MKSERSPGYDDGRRGNGQPVVDTLAQAGVGYAYPWRVGFAAAMGGFLFGYDTGIIGGAMTSLEEHFQMNAAQLGASVAIVFVGCILGAICGGFFSDRFGRRRVLFATAWMFLLSAVLTAIPQTIAQFNIARFVGGVGIGISLPVAGVYLAEISPARVRGRMVSLNQLAITFGILVSYVVGWFVADIGSEAWQIATSWRWTFGTEALPAALFAVVLMLIPESPRWLIQQGRTDEALAVLTRIDGPETARREIDEIRRVIDEEDVAITQLLKPGLRIALIIGIMLSLFDQITGINIVIYYIQKILLQVGFSKEAAGQGMIALGVVNFLTTILALALLDRVGRKPLLMFCPLGMSIAMLLLGFQFYTEMLPPIFVLVTIILYSFFYALGLGPGILLLLSEIFPTHVRGKAAGVCTVFMWVSCYFVSEQFPTWLEWSQSGTFWILSGTSFTMFLFVWLLIPETKGKTLEEIEQFWRRRGGARKNG
ncbi:MAG: sugar porter family MFS transporter [Candidatus Nealsonbacteria bacterium]|nr:sugar porter family MFS transporter [Candidatus Nealsonbacteria bacterium]